MLNDKEREELVDTLSKADDWTGRIKSKTLFKRPNLKQDEQLLLDYFFSEFLSEDAEELGLFEELAELCRALKETCES